MTKIIDLTGQTFGQLLVLRQVGMRRRYALWLCRCSCGNECQIISGSLRRGHTKSCGCINRLKMTTHGLSKTREFGIWQGMINRCCNPKVKGYPNYGGSGVSVCERWQRSFSDFLADMGPAPSDKHSIDRFPDCAGNYEPSNCRWATSLEQGNNRRATRKVNYHGTEMSLCDAVRLAGSVIHHEAAWIRIKTGWTVERALETPRLFISHASKSYTGQERAKVIITHSISPSSSQGESVPISFATARELAESADAHPRDSAFLCGND